MLGLLVLGTTLLDAFLYSRTGNATRRRQHNVPVSRVEDHQLGEGQGTYEAPFSGRRKAHASPERPTRRVLRGRVSTRLYLLLVTDIGACQFGADHVAFGPDGHPPALARLDPATQDAALQELSAYMDCSPQERLPTAAQLSRLLERAGVCVPLVRGPLRGECQA